MGGDDWPEGRWTLDLDWFGVTRNGAYFRSRLDWFGVTKIRIPCYPDFFLDYYEILKIRLGFFRIPLECFGF